MMDPREGRLTAGRGPSVLIDGVPYDGGNTGFISGLMSGGGASVSFIGTFGPGMILTRAEGGMQGPLPQSQSRPLTGNEAQAAKLELPGLNTDAARVTYDMSGSAAYTPRNTMHFPSDVSGCRDFIKCNDGRYAGWFIHEVTHVWQYQNGRSPFWGRIFSVDVFILGDYLPQDAYMNLPSPNGLSTEQEADWHQLHYELCTVRRNPDACAWR